jgi:plastocyanin
MTREVTMTPIHRRGPLAASALAGLAGLALAACGGGSGARPAAARTAAPVATPSPAATPAAAPVATTSVDIANFAFGPAVITVRSGATVTWTNRDEDAHTISITGSPASRPLENGDTFAHTFGQPGTYAYVCTIHPFMHGRVVVTP